MNDLFEMLEPYFKEWVREVLDEREKRQTQQQWQPTGTTEK